MSRLLRRSGLRYHAKHPWQLALAALGIALGVAVVVAVDVATGSARRAFELSGSAISGRATHEVTGGPTGLPDSLYATVRVELGVDSAAPVIDRFVTVPGAGDATLRLLGVDPFAEAPFRPWLAPSADSLDIGVLLTRRAVLLAAPTAARLGLAPGDSFTIATSDRAATAVLAGVLAPADPVAERALAAVLLADIATAQELTGMFGRLDRIELVLTDTAATVVSAALPPGARLIETDVRTGAVARLTRAFDTNLTALALVALVFGMFLIYNSVTFSVVQRRPLIGLLRAQGVTRTDVLRLIAAEALILGTVATTLGIIAGWLLGTQLVALVARTINDLYFTVNVTSVTLTPLQIVKSGVLGVAATMTAAFPPAIEASRAQPRAALARASLERRARSATGKLAAAGAVCAVIAAALLFYPSISVVPGFAALFVLMLGVALAIPAATMALMHAVRPLLSRIGPVARMAAGGVSSSLSRTAPAIAALSVAVAVGISVTVMIGSFRAGVVDWLGRTLQADLYISAPGLGASRTDVSLRAGFPGQVRALAEVDGITTYRHATLLVDDDLVRLIAVRMHPPQRDAYEFLDADAAAAWPVFERGGVFISEPIAFRRGLGAGDSIELPTDRGPRAFPIAAVYRDYASEHGVIFLQREYYDAAWDDVGTTSLAVFLADGADADAVADRIRGLPGAGGAFVRSDAALRETSLQVFDRTFVITGVLRLLALIVAFVGVTGALMALQLERAREVGVLRAIGLTPRQVRALVLLQTGLMGFTAAVIAVPLGLAMSWAMVNVINRRSFGWTFDMVLDADPFLQAILIGIGAALLAGLYPARRLASGRALGRAMTRATAVLALTLAACADSDPAVDARLELAELLGGADTLHARAVEPRPFEFPADHGPHPEFRTEWWYFTGALETADGRAVGYQLTFFRSALTDSASFAAADTTRSDWRTRQAWMAHLAVSDGGDRDFSAHERFARGAAGLAGARAEPFRVWVGAWSAEAADTGMFPLRLKADAGDVAIDLTLENGKPIVLQGDRGLSRKGAAPGNASYYYSMTRLPTAGTIAIGGATHTVRGASWLDREWSTSVLAPGIDGWDWFALQFDDGTELMLYRLRRPDGSADGFSAGMFIGRNGDALPLSNDEFRLTPGATWSGRGYPIEWSLTAPRLGLALGVEAVHPEQELLLSVRYWEGMIRASGTRDGREVRGRGYLEMTGY